jgi:hypothetical protein
MFLAWATLIVALAISCTSAFFSITGLTALFAASFWSIIAMGVVIEAGKIVAACWLHKHWHDIRVSKLHKFYLSCALIVAMAITSLGIFGFLSESYINQKAPVNGSLIEIQQDEKDLDFKKDQLQNLDKQLEEINRLSSPDKTNKNLDRQRNNIMRQEEQLRNQINQLQHRLDADKQKTSNIDIKLGPVKYLAGLLFNDPENHIDRAVQIMIGTIMIVFDPMAIALVLAASTSFRLAKEDKLEKKEFESSPRQRILKNNDNITEKTPEQTYKEMAQKPVEIISYPVKEPEPVFDSRPIPVFTPKKFQSESMKAIHETVEGLHETGAIDDKTMEEFNEVVLVKEEAKVEEKIEHSVEPTEPEINQEVEPAEAENDHPNVHTMTEEEHFNKDPKKSFLSSYTQIEQSPHNED